MSLDEIVVSRAIIRKFFEKLESSLELDVAIVGGGPSGLTAAWKLAEQGFNVALFERKLSVGGGMWGGGMTYNIIVVQDEAVGILQEAGVPTEPYGRGYHTADAVAATTVLASRACVAGAKVFNCMSAEDVLLREEDGEPRVAGLVISSSPVEIAGLHVDPLTIRSRYVVEATGHDVELLKTLVRKNGVRLNTPTGDIAGERSMWAEPAERDTPENTREIFPGVFVAGMACNAGYGSFRMGPIFGGMLLSGVRVAELIAARLKG
jgi:thiamine thiazole synthase